MIDDPFDALSPAIRGRYLKLADLPHRPFWNLIPAELRAILEEVIASGQNLRHYWERLAIASNTLSGGPRVPSGTEQNEFVYGMLGFHLLAYREGRFGWDELLSMAFHTADSYCVEIDGVSERMDGRPFLVLRNELRERGFTEADNRQIEELFAPYIGIAEACAERWGLKAAT